MATKNTPKTDIVDPEGKTVAQSPRRQTVAGSITAEAYEALETYRWDNRMSKAQVLEAAVNSFLESVSAA